MTEKEYTINLIEKLIPKTKQMESYYAQIGELQQINESIQRKGDSNLSQRRLMIKLPVYLLSGFLALQLFSFMFFLKLFTIPIAAACVFGIKKLYEKVIQPKLDAVQPHPDALRKIEENEARIQAINGEACACYQQNENLFRSFPEDYLYTDALYFMDRALKNGRADSLKEAINLYEDTVYKQNIANEMRQHHEEQIQYLRSIENESRRAANNAANAAFWGAMNYMSNH